MRSTMTRRRWLFGASSAALALPALEYFMPRRASATALTHPRLLVYYVPNGRRPEWWVPTMTDNGLEFPAESSALQPFADQAISLVNLANDAAKNSPGAAHAMGTGTVMTGTKIPEIAGGVLHNNVSLDQLIVQQLMPETRFPSLQWSSGRHGTCDVGGASCSYTRCISWSGAASPLAATIDPLEAFDRVFGDGVNSFEGLQGAAADIRRKSVQSTIDFVREDALALQNKLGHSDRMRLDEYFTSLIELENSLIPAAGGCDLVDQQAPDSDLSFPEKVNAFHQLIKLAFQCDQTRFISFMIEFGLSNRVYDFVGSSGTHHGNSHNNFGNLRPIEQWQNDQIGALLQLLRDTPGPTGGTLLDETIVLAIPSMGEGKSHDHRHNCPMLFGGKDVLTQGGRQISFPNNNPNPLPNLHVTLLEAFGIGGSFGSNGAIFGDDGTTTISGVLA